MCLELINVLTRISKRVPSLHPSQKSQTVIWLIWGTASWRAVAQGWRHSQISSQTVFLFAYSRCPTNNTQSSPDGRQAECHLWSIRRTLSCFWCWYIETKYIVDIWKSHRIKGKSQFRREKLNTAQQKPLTILPVFISLYHGKAKATYVWTSVLISAQDIDMPSRSMSIQFLAILVESLGLYLMTCYTVALTGWEKWINGANPGCWSLARNKWNTRFLFWNHLIGIY
jgi:hypothetical protein